VAIFQYRADPTFHFCRKRGVPFDCLGDPGREGYDAVGLGRGGVSEYVGPKIALNLLRAARHGGLPGVPKGDVSQRPGTFVVGSDGRVALAHYNRDSTDHPPIEGILRTVRGLADAAQPPST